MAQSPDSTRITGFQYAIGSILLVSLAQLLLKYSTRDIDGFDIFIIYDIQFLVSLFSAGIVYLLSIFLWIRTLSHLPLNVAYPLLSLSYPMVYIAASTCTCFDETFSAQRNLSVLLIVFGVVIASKK